MHAKLCTLALVIGAVSCSTGGSVRSAAPTTTARVPIRQTTQPIPVTALRELSPLAGASSPPSQMAADPVQGGVWFWSDTSSATELYHVGDKGITTRRAVGKTRSDGLLTSFDTPIAVGADGSVWLAANTTIMRFVPSSGAISSWSLALPVVAADPDHRRLPQDGITAIAVSPTTGTVALVSRDALVTLLDPTTGIFSAAPGSIAGAVASVAYLSDGTLIVGSLGLYSTGGAVERVRPDGTSKRFAVYAGFLAPDGQSVIAAGGQLARVNATSSTALGNPAAAASARNQSPTALDLDAPIAITPNGNIVTSTRSGLAILNSSGMVTDTLALPEFDCSGMSDVGPTGPNAMSSTTVRLPTTCTQSAQPLATDGAGSVFFFTTGPGSELEELPAPKVPSS